MLQVDPIQSYLNLKIGLPSVLKARSVQMFSHDNADMDQSQLVLKNGDLRPRIPIKKFE